METVLYTIVSYVLDGLTAALCIAAPLVAIYFGGKALVNCYTEYFGTK